MRNVYVVRHTESVHHVQGLAGGWYDTSLTDKGKEQARKVADGLFNEVQKPGIPIWSSDLKRCSEMADVFAAVFRSPVTLDRDLREMSGGECEGKNQEWVVGNVMPLPKDGNRLDHHAFIGSETRRDVGTRMQSFLERLTAGQAQDMIVITHGFAMSFLIMAWFKVPVEHMDYCDFSRTRPGSVTLLHEDDVFRNRHIVYVGRNLV